MQIQSVPCPEKGRGILVQEKSMEEPKKLRLTQTVKGAG
jgi:hypothetical protein